MKSPEQSSEKLSRKKPVLDTQSIQSTSTILTPNLRYNFLTDHAGDPLPQLRQEQIEQIMGFFMINVHNLVQDGHKGAKEGKRIVLVIGPPGTGKTSAIKYCLDRLMEKKVKYLKDSCQLKSINIVSFNAHSLYKCTEITKQLLKTASPSQQSLHKKSQIKNREHLLNKDGISKVTVVWVEEFDKIVEGNGDEQLGEFVEMFLHDREGQIKQGNHRYILIGTSNTINLQQMLTKKLSKKNVVSSIFFNPYSVQSLVKILKDRLHQIKTQLNLQIIITQKQLKFLISKLQQNKKDDTRTVIQLVKQLLMYAKEQKQVNDKLEKGESCSIEIKMENINQIQKVKALLSNSKAALIEKLNFKQQLLLVLIYVYMKRSQALEMPYLQVVEQFRKYQKSMALTAYEDVTVAVKELQTYDCVQIRTKNASLSKSNSKRNNSSQKNTSKLSIILKVSLKDIEVALSPNPIFLPYFQ